MKLSASVIVAVAPSRVFSRWMLRLMPLFGVNPEAAGRNGDAIASGSEATATTDPVEVRGGLDDRWVDGFEVCETVRDEHGVRYRIRRLVDRVVLPDLFTEQDVRRPVRTAEEPGPTRVRRWSPF